MISYKVSRRSFLRGCGGAAPLLLPLLRSMEARAAGMPAPLRFLVIQHPLGSPIDLWRPAAVATTTSFTLPVNSAPFAPLQSQMVMVDGLNLVTASNQAGNNGGMNSSEGGMVAAMTGVPTLGQIGQQDHAAGGPSIDQILLDRSPMLGGSLSTSPTKTMFGSLQLAADIRSERDELAPRVLSYRPPLIGSTDITTARQPLFPETQPLNVYNRIFTGALPSSTTGGAVLAQELSVLDFMRSDLARLRSLAPSSEKDRLDAHASAIQSLEASIRAAYSQGNGCTRPPAPSTFPMNGTGATGGTAPPGGSLLRGVDYYDPNDPNNHPHPDLGQAHLALMKAAFLCDLVRVGTFMWAAGTSWVQFPTTLDGATITAAGPVPSLPAYPGSGYEPRTSPDVTGWWAAIDRFYARQTSIAIQDFAQAKDSDGNSLLDNTIIVYLSEISRRYDHDMRNMPLLVFGGKNTRLRGGTFLEIKDGPLPTADNSTTGAAAATGNRPFNDLWLAIAPVFGVNLGTLGSPAQYTGPLPGLFS